MCNGGEAVVLQDVFDNGCASSKFVKSFVDVLESGDDVLESPGVSKASLSFCAFISRVLK